MKIKIFPFILLFLPLSLTALSPNEAFNRLIEGNQRFYNKKTNASTQNPSVRLSLVEAQSPFAVIVACADSRVAPEIVFDQTIGGLFVIRVAGNVIGSLELESIQYAIDHLGSTCILVMGHQNCGAVDAVIQKYTQEIPFIAQIIKPAVIRAFKSSSNNILKKATELNALQMASFLKNLEPYSSLINQNKLTVRAAYYNFETGKVEILD